MKTDASLLSQLQSAIDKRSSLIGELDTLPKLPVSVDNLHRVRSELKLLRETQVLEKRIYGRLLELGR